MFTVEIDGKKVDAKVTFYTAYLYELEFRSDLIRDLYGVQTNDNLFDVELVGDGEEKEVRVTRIDFTKVSWLTLAKVLWAAVKTADRATPSYAEWMAETAGVDLWELKDLIGNEVADCFFRAGTAEKEAQEAE